MLKIALVLTPIDFGGAEKVNYILLKYALNSEIEYVPILLVRPWEVKGNPFLEKIKKEGYRHYEIPITIKQDNQGRDYLRVLRAIKMLNRIICRENFDLIHSNGYFANMISLVSAKLNKKPVLSTAHGFIWNDLKLKLYNRLDLFLLGFFDKIIAVSEELKNDFLKAGIKRTKIEVVHNAIELIERSSGSNRAQKRLEYGVREDQIVFGYVGRLSREKNVDYIIKAIKKIKDKGLSAVLLIAGTGPEEKRLKAQAEKMELRDEVKFLGFCREVEKLIPIFNCLIVASKTEGTPMALLEAMAYGMPVIATRVGGIPKVIEDQFNGILIEPNDIEAICQAAKQLIGDRNKCERLAYNARKTIKKRFGPGPWFNKYLEVYQDMI